MPMPRVLLPALLLAAAAVAETHPFTVHDLVALDRLSGLSAAPDGKQAVFQVRVTELDRNRGKTDLWLLNVADGSVRRLTSHASSSHSPVWAPDGRTIYFLSARGGSTQIWRIAVDGGEAEQVTDLPLDVETFKLSPDGATFALSAPVYADLRTMAETKARLDEKAEEKHTGLVYDQLFVRHWDTWKDGRRSHLFTLPVAGGEPVDVTSGFDADVPLKPFGGAEDYAFTPDSKGLVFVCRNVGRSEAWSTDVDLWLTTVDGRSAPKNLTPENEAMQGSPVFSPDGKTLAYLAMKRPGYESDRTRIVLREWDSGKTRWLTEAWDRSPHSIHWTADGQKIYTVAADLGQDALFAVSVADGAPTKVIAEGRVSDVNVLDEQILYGLQHLRSPTEFYSMPRSGGSSRKLTEFNDERLAQIAFGEPEQFTFTGWNDETVYCYVVKPANLDESRKYPVAFLIHGGPQGSFGNMFHYRWNAQTYAGAGYAAVMVDFHGSTGYGQAFTDSINGHWGDRPLEDLKLGLEAALKKYPWMDGERVAALGASYGGYMINWIAGNWPDRFRCLVCHDGNLDELMAYYDTEELWFPEWERGGTAWEKPEAYAEHSPVHFVKNWKTPMLVIHGALDYRVVDTQGIATFTALQRKGVPSRLLYFPDENHWVLKPHNSIQWHNEVLGWLDKWTR